MHDPQTVAFEIKYPWWRYRPWPKKHRYSEDCKWTWQHRLSDKEKQGRDSFWNEGYRDTFITIWHVDPEKDGSDDSCGWAWPKLTPRQREILRNASWSEGHAPHFLCCCEKKWAGTIVEAELLYRGLCLLVARVLKIKLTFAEISRYASESTHVRTVGHAGDVFCFLPGYHTNNPKDSEKDREDHFYGIMCGVARSLLDLKRRWWQKPRWHFWHWKIQCHPLQTFKRWAFSRCCKCGGRFAWGYSPVTNSWYGKGPRWFRSEKDVYHSDCNHPQDPCLAENKSLPI